MRKSFLLVLFAVMVTALALSQTTPSTPAGTAAQETNQSNPQQPPAPNPPTTYNENQNQAPAAAPANQNQPAPPNTVNQAQPPAPGTLGQRPVQPQYPGGRMVPAGTPIQATLDTPLSTKTSQVGDRFTATVAAPVNDANGRLAIPVGTKINGRVSQSEQGKTVAILRGRGRLDLQFIDMTFPNGTSTPLSASLKSVNHNGSTQKSDEEGGVQSTTSGKTTAKDVGIGAGLGTVAGLIFGSALKGLAIGAIAGGGYVLATKGKDVELPANSGLVLGLDQNLSVPANTGGR